MSFQFLTREGYVRPVQYGLILVWLHCFIKLLLQWIMGCHFTNISTSSIQYLIYTNVNRCNSFFTTKGAVNVVVTLAR